MLLEILYKLSVKELHRNKTVCKLWSSLISHPCFPSQYSVRRRNSSSSYTLYLNSSNIRHNEEGWSIDSPIVSLDFLHNFVLGSSNGLLLSSYKTDKYNPFKVTYYVVNPLTKKHLTLPSPSTSIKHYEYVVLSGIVVYNCDSSNYQTHEFKVVRIVRDAFFRVSNVLDIEIFESTTKQWKVLRTEIDSKIAFKSGNAVEHRGILYWVLDRRDSILIFNPIHDLCHRISLPVSNVRNLCIGLGVSQDHLYYVQINFRAPNIPCTILRCEEFNGEYIWTVCRSLDLDWINQQQIEHLDSLPYCELLLIDPMDYNILYLCYYRLYSIDVAKRVSTELSSAPAFNCVMLVEPTWPTDINS